MTNKKERLQKHILTKHDLSDRVLREHVLNTVCPWCKAKINRTMTENKGRSKPPVPGEISFCSGCGEWAGFSDDLGLRKLTDEELIEIAQDENCRSIRLAWVMTRADFLIGGLKARGVTTDDLARAINSEEGDLHTVPGEMREQWDELRALMRGLRCKASA
jgi:hypothetical protein